MSMLRAAATTVQGLGNATGQQVVLRVLTAMTAAVGFPVLVELAGGDRHPVLITVLAVLGLLVGIVPAGNVPLFWSLVAAGTWLVSVPEALDGWTMAATAALVVVHLCCTLTGYGPPTLGLPAPLVRLWAGRAAVMLATTTLVWLAARLVAGLTLPGSALVYGSALLLATGWSAYLLRRMLARDGS
jgi:hypothetical protein